MVADITGPATESFKEIGLVRRENRNGVVARTALTPCGSADGQRSVGVVILRRVKFGVVRQLWR